MSNQHAEALIERWFRNSIGAKEDFDFLILEFLETLDDNISIKEVLLLTGIRSLQVKEQYPDDLAIQLSHSAFYAALRYQLQFWEDDDI